MNKDFKDKINFILTLPHTSQSDSIAVVTTSAFTKAESREEKSEIINYMIKSVTECDCLISYNSIFRPMIKYFDLNDALLIIEMILESYNGMIGVGGYLETLIKLEGVYKVTESISKQKLINCNHMLIRTIKGKQKLAYKLCRILHHNLL